MYFTFTVFINMQLKIEYSTCFQYTSNALCRIVHEYAQCSAFTTHENENAHKYEAIRTTYII